MIKTHLWCCHQHADRRKVQWSMRSQLLQGSPNTACWPLEQQTGTKKEINTSQFFWPFSTEKKDQPKGASVHQKFCFGAVTTTCKKRSPLFQLYSFLTSTLPLGLNGPFSENAPTPTDEQPGPTFTCTSIIRISLQEKRIVHCNGSRAQFQREGESNPDTNPRGNLISSYTFPIKN